MEKKRNSIIIILLLIILFLFGYIFLSKNDKPKTEDNVQTLEMTQSDYVKPEEPVDRSQNVTLPGWGGFTIPANTKKSQRDLSFIILQRISGMKIIFL